MPSATQYRYFKYLGSYPGDAETPWSNNLQGITSGDGCWYLTQSEGRVGVWLDRAIWHIPIEHDLSESIPESDLLKVDLPAELASYLHIGDPAYARGFLFVPLEDDFDKRLKPDMRPRIAAFSAGLEYIGSAVLEGQLMAGWCAIDPVDAVLYTSEPFIQMNHDDFQYGPIRRYHVDWDALESSGSARLRLRPVQEHFMVANDVGVPMQVAWMQGGTFTGDGKLVLVNGEAMYCFDRTGALHAVRLFSQDRDYELRTLKNEMEGVAFMNPVGTGAPGIRGNIHAIMLNEDVFHDNFFLKHYEIRSARFMRNRRSGETHKWPCVWARKTKPINREPVHALKEGDEGCYYCLPAYNHR